MLNEKSKSMTIYEKLLTVSLCLVVMCLIFTNLATIPNEIHAAEAMNENAKISAPHKNHTGETELAIVKNQKGAFSLAEDESAPNVITIQKESEEIFKERATENYFLKVTSEIFIAVTKNVYSQNMDYDISQIKREGFFTETTAAVLDFLKDGKMKEVTLTVYSPKNDQGYRGHEGKGYFQELHVYSSSSEEKVLNSKAKKWQNHLNKLLDGVENSLEINGTLIKNPKIQITTNTVVKTVESLRNGQNASKDYFVHKAKLREDLTVKNIYMISDTTKILTKFAQVQKTHYCYDNIFEIKGGTATSDVVFVTDFFTKSTESYDSAEEKALEKMKSETKGFYSETITKHFYNGVVFK